MVLALAVVVEKPSPKFHAYEVMAPRGQTRLWRQMKTGAGGSGDHGKRCCGGLVGGDCHRYGLETDTYCVAHRRSWPCR